MLVIFDCDGVLVDSEPLAADVFSGVLGTLGIELTPQDCYQKFHGHSLRYCFDWLERTTQQTLPDDFAERLAIATREAFNKDLRAVPGVERVIEMLNDYHVSFCVASNGGHRKISNSLALTGLDKYFNERRANCFSIEDVAHGKPAPDLFLYAAEAMGVPPAFTTVIEDSPSGIAAAEAAGMNLFVYDAMGEISDSPHETFATMADIQAHLQSRWQR